MIGYLEMDSGHEILWACRMDCELQKYYDQILLFTIWLCSITILCLSHAFSIHALREWARLRAHINVTTFTRFA